jgi:protein TonB
MAPINIVPPRYPDFARANRIEGAVTLAANISPQGKITGLKPVSGNAVFVKPAMAAVSRWTYRPASVNGVPVAAATMIRVKFRLSNREERH